MTILDNETLLESYHTAVKLDLEPEFIMLLLAEIRKRNLSIHHRNERQTPQSAV